MKPGVAAQGPEGRPTGVVPAIPKCTKVRAALKRPASSCKGKPPYWLHSNELFEFVSTEPLKKGESSIETMGERYPHLPTLAS